MSQTQYVVTGAYITAAVSTDAGTRVLGFERGAVLPDTAPDATVQHLLSVGLIEEVSKAEDLDLYPPPMTVASTGVVDPAGAGIGDSQQATSTEEPAGNASKAEWVEYAVSQGMPREDAEAATRDDLRDKYSA